MGLVLAYTVYITAQSIQAGFQSDADWSDTLGQLRASSVNAVVLESYRGGLSVDADRMRAVRDRFQSEGFETLGGIMPVWGEGFGTRGEGVETRLPFFCYSSETTVSALEGEIRKLSRLFDRVVIDDAYLTSCRCATCDTARQGVEWPQFRRELLSSVARRWVLAAHRENPNVALAVKFPQYYDRHHLFGYDAATFPKVFDAIWIGTETRDPETPKYGFTEPYQGYFNIRWMKACAGERFESAWFDYLDCDQRLFEHQGLTTALGQPPRTTLFCLGPPLLDERAPGLAKRTEELTELWTCAAEPWGVHVIKPPNSDGGGDLFIFDDLGMLGIPCVPSCRLDAGMKSVILTGHAASDPKTLDMALDILNRGGQVIATHQALRHMADRPDILAAFGYTARGVALNRTPLRAVDIGGRLTDLTTPLYAPGDLEPEEGVEILAYGRFGTWSDGRVPLVTRHRLAGGGSALVWNLGTFGHDAYSMEEHLCVPVKTGISDCPQPLADLLRNSALAPLGVQIEAPARVGVFLFGQDAVFVNYNDAPAVVTWMGLPSGGAHDPDDSKSPVTVNLPPDGHVRRPLNR